MGWGKRLGVGAGVGVLAAGTLWLGAGFIDLAMTPVVSSAGRELPGDDDEEFGKSVRYAVGSGATLSPDPSDEWTAQAWDIFVRVVTPEYAAENVSEFRVADVREKDTFAYVSLEGDDAPWVLAANTAHSRNRDLALATMIHEYAHMLSLGPDQIDVTASECETVWVSTGCPRAHSVLLEYNRQFWAPYGDDAPSELDDDRDAAYSFFLDHEEDFVTGYAATNVGEDFAETFMTFVLEPKPDADTPVARKIDFFWELPEYVSVRDRLRAEFSLD